MPAPSEINFDQFPNKTTPHFRAELRDPGRIFSNQRPERAFKLYLIDVGLLPDDLEIDTKIFMDGNISEANNIIPLYLGILLFFGRRNAGTRLTNDLELFKGLRNTVKNEPQT